MVPPFLIGNNPILAFKFDGRYPVRTCWKCRLLLSPRTDPLAGPGIIADDEYEDNPQTDASKTDEARTGCGPYPSTEI